MRAMTDPSVPWSFEALRANEAWLRPLVRALVDDATADDVLQDTWLQAWRNPPRSARAGRGWLATVATNFARSRRRDAVRRQRLAAAAAMPADAAVESTAATVERLALHRSVSAAVLELPEPFRSAVLLHHYHGLDTATIAARLGTSAANVRQRLHRGHEWLRARLAAERGGDWRRSPAVLALLAPDATPATPPPTPAAVTLVPALFAMTKIRIVLATLVVGSLIGGALLAPRLLSPEVAGAPHGATPPVAAGTPQPDRAAPDAASAANDDRRLVGVADPANANAPSTGPSGTVLDTRGRPVAGVRIVERGDERAPAVELATADANGAFTLPAAWPSRPVDAAEPWVVLAVQPPQSDPPEPAMLVVAPCRRQSLRVVDPQGSPLANAQVDVHNRGLLDFPQVLERASQRGFADATTDADGRAAWPCLPLVATTIAVRRSGYAPQVVALDAGVPAELLLTLQPLREGARVVSGTVTDARGAWIAGAKVGLAERQTTADAYGHFVLQLPPGEEIRAEAPLHASAPGWYPAVVPDFGKLLLAANGGALQQELRLDRPVVAIAGEVVDERGTACADVLVYPWRLPLLTERESAEDLAMPADAPKLSLAGNPIRAFARTDAQGRFVLSGLDARDYQLLVHDERAKWAHTSAPIRGGTNGVVIRLPHAPVGAVAGRVTSRDGAPAAGVLVKGHVIIHGNGGGIVGIDVGQRTTTDADGRFRIERMPLAGVTATFHGDDWIDGSLELAQQRDLEALEVRLLRRCHVRVECTGAQWADADVRFEDAAGEVVMITEKRRTTTMTRYEVDLHRGKTGVLAISESATTMVLRTRDGKRTERVPVAPRPGEVTSIVHQVD
jgi:RNA polymerase sigma-70 factor (ECF subfamily)